MPANKKASTRYKILDELLSDRYHNYSLNDLTEIVSDKLVDLYPKSNGVTRRTIEKDIFYLEQEGPYFVDIERYSATAFDKETQKEVTKRCLRYRKPGFSIFKKEMSSDEKYLLSEVLNILGQFDGLPNLQNLEQLRQSLDIPDRAPVISFSHNPYQDTTLLGELFTCISQKQVIEIFYHTFKLPGIKKSIVLCPYLLKEYNRRWYLFGSCETDRKLLCFGVERIDGVHPLPSHVFEDYEGNIQEYFDDIIGVTNLKEKEVLDIKFWVNDKSVDYVLTKPLHDSQIHLRGDKEQALRIKYPNLIDGAFFEIKCKYNYELLRELTSYEQRLIVISPRELKEDICMNLNSMLKMYDSIK